MSAPSVARGLQFDHEGDDDDDSALLVEPRADASRGGSSGGSSGGGFAEVGLSAELGETSDPPYHGRASAAILADGPCENAPPSRGRVLYENYSAYGDDDYADDYDEYEEGEASEYATTSSGESRSGAFLAPAASTAAGALNARPHGAAAAAAEASAGTKAPEGLASAPGPAAAQGRGGGALLRYPYYADDTYSDEQDDGNDNAGGDGAEAEGRFLRVSTDEELEWAEAQGPADEGGLASYGAGEWRASGDTTDGAAPDAGPIGAFGAFSQGSGGGGGSGYAYGKDAGEGATYEASASGSSYAADDSYDRGAPPTGAANSGFGAGSLGDSLESGTSPRGLGGGEPSLGRLPGGLAAALGGFRGLMAAVDQQHHGPPPQAPAAPRALATPRSAPLVPLFARAPLSGPLSGLGRRSSDACGAAAALGRHGPLPPPRPHPQPLGAAAAPFQPQRGRTPPPQNQAPLLAPLTAATHLAARTRSASPAGRARFIPAAAAAAAGSNSSGGGLGSNRGFGSSSSGLFGSSAAAAATPQLRLRATDPSPTGVGAFYGTPSPQPPTSLLGPSTPYQLHRHGLPLGSSSKVDDSRRGLSLGLKQWEVALGPDANAPQGRPALLSASKKEPAESTGSECDATRGLSELL
jgi:hypothetical protein